MLENQSLQYNITTPTAVIFTIYMSAAIVVAIIGNVMTLIVIHRHSSLHNTAGYLMANLAIADLLIAIFNMPATIASLSTSRWPFSDTICQTSAFMMTFITGVSLFTLVVISIDRCVSIKFPLRYKQYCLFHQYFALFALLWMFPAVTATIPLLGLQRYSLGKYQYLDSKAYCWIAVYRYDYNIGYVILVMFTMFTALTSFTLCYGIIYRSAKANYIQIVRCSHLPEVNRKKFKSNLKTASTLSILVGVFLFCWGPLVLIDIVSIIAQSQFYNFISIASLRLALSNSAYNPVIYGIFNQSFRAGFKEIIHACYVKIGLRQNNEIQNFHSDVHQTAT